MHPKYWQLILLVTCSACLNPLAMRRAKVLDPGEFEIILAPEIVGVRGDPDTRFAPVFQLIEGDPTVGAATLAGRVGVGHKLDLQLKLDASFWQPELGLGYELLSGGTTKPTLSLLTGIRGTVMGEGEGVGRFLHVPVALALDLPFAETDALYGGFGITSSFSFAAKQTYTAFSPRFFVGLSLEFWDWLLVQPEIAVQQSFIGPGGPARAALGVTHFSMALGLGVRR